MQKAQTEIENLLGGRLKDAELRLLREERYLDEIDQAVAVGDLDLASHTAVEAANAVRRHRRFAAEGRRAAGRIPKTAQGRHEDGEPDWEEWALAALATRLAERDYLVRAFRDEFLPEGRIAFRRVQAWMRSTATADGRPSAGIFELFVDEANLPKTVTPKSEINVRGHGGVSAYGAPRLQYLRPGRSDELQHDSVPYRGGGVLHSLAVVTKHLRHAFRWDESEAASWVISDVPYLPAVDRWTVRLDAGGMSLGITKGGLAPRWFPNDRLVIEIDPSVSVKELATIYRQARERIAAVVAESFPGAPDRRRDPTTSVSSRKAKAIWFDAAHPDLTSNQKVAIWNKTYADDPYGHAANFRRDVSEGTRALLGDQHLIV